MSISIIFFAVFVRYNAAVPPALKSTRSLYFVFGFVFGFILLFVCVDVDGPRRTDQSKHVGG